MHSSGFWLAARLNFSFDPGKLRHYYCIKLSFNSAEKRSAPR